MAWQLQGKEMKTGLPFKAQLGVGGSPKPNPPAPWGASLLRISWRRGCKQPFFGGFLVVHPIALSRPCQIATTVRINFSAHLIETVGASTV